MGLGPLKSQTFSQEFVQKFTQLQRRNARRRFNLQAHFELKDSSTPSKGRLSCV